MTHDEKIQVNLNTQSYYLPLLPPIHPHIKLSFKPNAKHVTYDRKRVGVEE